jgi:hypothetical protein
MEIATKKMLESTVMTEFFPLINIFIILALCLSKEAKFLCIDRLQKFTPYPYQQNAPK